MTENNATPTWTEFAQNVRGKEIRAVQEVFGVTWEGDVWGDLSIRETGEVVAFINFRRQGMSDAEAFDRATDLTVDELIKLIDWSFLREGEPGEEDGTETEPFPPVTPAGKDSALSD